MFSPGGVAEREKFGYTPLAKCLASRSGGARAGWWAIVSNKMGSDCEYNRLDHDNSISGFESCLDKRSKASYKSCIIRIEFNLVAARDIHILLGFLATTDGLPIFGDTGVRANDEILTRKSLADKLVASNNSAHSLQQFTSCVNLHDIALCARAKGFPHHIGRRFLAYK